VKYKLYKGQIVFLKRGELTAIKRRNSGSHICIYLKTSTAHLAKTELEIALCGDKK
jgi:hypothetical protein